jgi:hypothetical protein
MVAIQKVQQPPLQNLASAEEMTHTSEEQDLILHRVTAHVQRIQEHMLRVHVQYRLYETGVNVLDQHAIQEQEQQLIAQTPSQPVDEYAYVDNQWSRDDVLWYP